MPKDGCIIHKAVQLSLAKTNMTQEKLRVRVFRENPFCWQSKKILRLIQEKHAGQKLTSRLSVYTVLTEISSDYSTDEYDTWGIKIMEMAGVGYSTLRNILNEFEESGIIKRHQERTSKGTYGKLEITLLEPFVTDSQSQPNGKATGKPAVKPEAQLLQSIEDRIEDNKEINNRISKKDYSSDLITVNLEEEYVSEGRQDINALIKLFEPVNRANWKDFFRNKTERNALQDLVDIYGYEMVASAIRVLPETNGQDFMTSIISPSELKKKWSKLESSFKRKREQQVQKNGQIIIA